MLSVSPSHHESVRFAESLTVTPVSFRWYFGTVEQTGRIADLVLPSDTTLRRQNVRFLTGDTLAATGVLSGGAEYLIDEALEVLSFFGITRSEIDPGVGLSFDEALTLTTARTDVPSHSSWDDGWSAHKEAIRRVQAGGNWFRSGEERMIQTVQQSRNLVVITGAGMSADSGVPTFRGKGSSDASSLLTAEQYATDSASVEAAVDQIRSYADHANPHQGHHALREMWRNRLGSGGLLHLGTFNVDGLHQKGSMLGEVHEFHGNVWERRCTSDTCRTVGTHEADRCPVCGSSTRPNIVLYGEQPNLLASHSVTRALRNADFLLMIGVSGATNSTDTFIRTAKDYGAAVGLWTLDPDPRFATRFDHVVNASAAELPADLVAVRGAAVRCPSDR